MPFGNPVVGGTALVRSAIRSPNYVAGVAGWTINQNGTAEFSEVVINGGELLVTGDDGSDVHIYDSLGSAVIEFLPPPIAGHTLTPASMGTVVVGSTPILDIRGPRYDSGNYGEIVMYGAITGTPTSSMRIGADTITLGGANAVIIENNNKGVITTDRATGDPETWHAATLLNGWTGTARYKALASPDHSVFLNGLINPGTKADGTALFQLGTGWRPSTGQNMPAAVNITSAVGSESPHLFIDTAGFVYIYGGTACTTLVINGIFPID